MATCSGAGSGLRGAVPSTRTKMPGRGEFVEDGEDEKDETEAMLARLGSHLAHPLWLGRSVRSERRANKKNKHGWGEGNWRDLLTAGWHREDSVGKRNWIHGRLQCLDFDTPRGWHGRVGVVPFDWVLLFRRLASLCCWGRGVSRPRGKGCNNIVAVELRQTGLGWYGSDDTGVCSLRRESRIVYTLRA